MLGILNTGVTGRHPVLALHRGLAWRRVTAPLSPGGPMARPTLASGAVPLVTGIATATVLSGAAVFTVAHAGCEHPGIYRVHNGVVELVGGCVTPEDIPVAPEKSPASSPRPQGEAAATEPVLRP